MPTNVWRQIEQANHSERIRCVDVCAHVCVVLFLNLLHTCPDGIVGLLHLDVIHYVGLRSHNGSALSGSDDPSGDPRYNTLCGVTSDVVFAKPINWPSMLYIDTHTHKLNPFSNVLET